MEATAFLMYMSESISGAISWTGTRPTATHQAKLIWRSIERNFTFGSPPMVLKICTHANFVEKVIWSSWKTNSNRWNAKAAMRPNSWSWKFETIRFIGQLSNIRLSIFVFGANPYWWVNRL